jgi:hypothetical protein
MPNPKLVPSTISASPNSGSPIGSDASAPRPGDDEIGPARSAPGAPQPGGPIDHRHAGAMMRDQLGDIGLDRVAAALAPHDQPHQRRERLAQRQRSRLALASVAPQPGWLTRFRSALPGLKNGTYLSLTATLAPVRGLSAR